MQHKDQQGTTRRAVLRTGAATGTVAALGATGLLAGRAGAATTAHKWKPPYPPQVTDTSHCTPEAAAIFRGFFTAKSNHDVPRMMSYFSKANTTYIDAALGVALPSWQAARDTFTSLFPPLPADAISYPLRITGDTRSAVVEFEDTPSFFGQELRVLASVTFDASHRIIRWIDYWDGRSALIQNAVASTYPADFKDSEQNADRTVLRVAQALQAAFAAGDAAAAVALMSYDVVHEDLAAHTRVRGQIQAKRYYTRALGQLPYGAGASLLHVEGSRQGGGYEWSAAPGAAPMRRGQTGIELDETGKISRVSTIYDSSLLSYAAYQSLVGLAAEAPLS